MKIVKKGIPSASQDDTSYEIRLLRFLGENAFIMPESDKEMDDFISLCDSIKIELPHALKNPFDIVRKGLVEPRDILDSDNEDTRDIENNLAQAAREGKEIPAHILEKMKENRKNAEDKK
ncbi:hypothetical protein CLV24_105140 [Pontibacter ummariensis]|uniref:Uncharacterized protein n=1 Tax=Pontibacter ummariensis TaxID=1610492 RepID=A0A239DSF0_9BACT|nr:hypothetical protein [Pontibacter ummariensis]PRY13770.1 hypothetical protein CLV24_105140 [Pontibacter ummariensis]SNS35545.1 hypothetical protein SAMN06296052_105112 [Pontibacter ummariensis]